MNSNKLENEEYVSSEPKRNQKKQGRPKKNKPDKYKPEIDKVQRPEIFQSKEVKYAEAFGKTLVDVIRTEMNMQGISGIKLSKILGKSQTYVAWRLREAERFELFTALRVAAILGMSPAELFEETQRQLARREVKATKGGRGV